MAGKYRRSALVYTLRHSLTTRTIHNVHTRNYKSCMVVCGHPSYNQEEVLCPSKCLYLEYGIGVRL